MNKKIIMFFLVVCSLLGSYIPVWLGESMLGGWSVLGGLIGGFFGIWLGAWISKRYGD